MKKLRILSTSLSAVVLFTGLALSFNACTQQSPFEPDNSHETAMATLVKKGKDTKKKQKIKVLKAGDHGSFFKSKNIKAKKGGSIQIGDKISGKSKIIFKKNDLNADATISFAWQVDGKMIGDVVFSPHGIRFNTPVELELSYKAAKLDNVNEDKLAIYYYNDNLHEWEFVGGELDKKKKIIRGHLKHFSRYAVGWGE